MGEQREFTATRPRLYMALNCSLPALAVFCAFITTDMDPLAPIVVTLGCAGLIAILWRRHGRMVFGTDAVKVYDVGFSMTVKKEAVAGYVWRAPTNFMPFGDGIVFVATDPNNGIGLRQLAPIASASRFLTAQQEAVLTSMIEAWHPEIVCYRTPTKWRSRSPLVPKRMGGTDPPSPATQ